MSRCRACNVVMSEFELSAKYKDTSVYIDLCGRCLDGLDISVDADSTLSNQRPFDDYEDNDQVTLAQACKTVFVEEGWND